MDYVMPDAQAVKSLLSMIFGDDLTVSESPAELGGKTVATFIDDDDKLVALCACDREFIGYSGGALSMIPVDVCNESINGEMTEALSGNFYEVMNICSKLLMSESSKHLRLARTVDADTAAGMVAELEANGSSGAFSVDIPRYGKGSMHFLGT